ncbi:MAG TPA: hypothetical protein VFU70_03030, partial [Pseudolabrys sp.]|nr:hypothetical protein [Pseudolabrys sp.]
VPVPQRVSLLIDVELLVDVQLGVSALEAEENLTLAPHYHRGRFQFDRRLFPAPITVDGQATGATPAFGMKIRGELWRMAKDGDNLINFHIEQSMAQSCRQEMKIYRIHGIVQDFVNSARS